jgi:predicted O-linked N-acetylglucosamine transferase (SPINDLY family)
MTASAQQLFNDAIASLNAGRPSDAERHFKAVLRQQPDHVAALNILGVLLASQHKFGDAEPYLRSALRLSGNSDATHYNYATVLKGLGRPAEALDHFSKALAINPNVAQNWNNRGTVLNDLGRYADALADFDRAIALQPADPAAYCNKAKSLESLKRSDEALHAYDQALAAVPNFPDAWLGRAHVLARRGQHEQALAAYDAVLAQRPQDATAWTGRGAMLTMLSRPKEALEAYDKAIGFDANGADARVGRGNIHNKNEDADRALEDFDRAIAIQPDLAEAWVGRGNALVILRKFPDALTCFDRAIAINPALAAAFIGRGACLYELGRHQDAVEATDHARTLDDQFIGIWLTRGDALLQLQRYDEALASYHRAAEIDSKAAEPLLGMGHIQQASGDLQGAMQFYERANENKPNLTAISAKIFLMDFMADAGFAEHQKIRGDWARALSPKIVRLPPSRSINRDSNKRLVLGYVSGDFRMHSAAFSFGSVLRQHDKSQFEVVYYSNSVLTDDLTFHFEKMADRWRHVPYTTDDELAKMIRDDGVDILVDLSGHSEGNRLAAFARKPAPIQVTAWGHATGTGLPAIDYFFADPITVPPDCRRYFAERIYDLPCIIPTDVVDIHLAPIAPPVFERGHVTFGVFNRPSKISDPAVQVWAKLINSVPNARLMIKGPGLENERANRALMERLGAAGIGSDRVTLLGATIRKDHLATIQSVDICLDPFPQNGGVSTWEALRMGVPVVCLLGPWISSRLSASIVSAIGLPEWVADSEYSYLEIARQFASAPDRLRELRNALPAMIEASPAGNVTAYTRAVEAAYRTMWTEFCKSPRASELGSV